MSSLRIACVSGPDSGHMNPIMLIAEALAARGHTIQLITFAFGEAKYAKKTAAFGGEFVGLPCPLSEKEILDKAVADGTVPFPLQRDYMIDNLRTALQRFQPDVIVSDFVTLAPMEVSEELGVPLVLNVPGPLAMAKTIVGVPDFTSGFSMLGLTTFYTPFSGPALAETLHLAGLHKVSRVLRKHVMRSLVAVNSFFGLEPADLLPPNVQVTGPLDRPPKAAQLAQTHPELHAFLERATQVVYITTGSMVILPDWIVAVLFHALKATGCSVVWSLKEERQQFVPDRSDPAFFISSWLPQPALLQHEKIAAVITHCGWGGTLECLSGGKPVLPLPFFGDQADNAQILVNAGVGELVGPLPAFGFDVTGASAYKPGSLTAESIAAAVLRMLGNPRYRQNAQRLKTLGEEPGGAAALAIRIELAARNGVRHLHNEAAARKIVGGKPTIFYAVPALIVLAVGAIAAAVARGR